MTMSRTDAVHEASTAKWPTLIVGIKHLRSEMLHLLGFSFMMNLLVLAVPVFMIQVFDRVLTSHSIETLTLLAIGTITALIIMMILDIIRGRIIVRVAGTLEQKLSTDMSRDRHINGFADVAKLRNFLNGPALITCLDMPWVPLFIALIFIIHPTLGWIALCGAAMMLCLAYLSERLTRSNVIASRRADDTLGNFTQHFSKHTKMQRSNRSLSGFANTWHSTLEQAAATRIALLDRLQTSAAIGRFLRLVLQISLISGAAVLVTTGQLTAGGMIAASVIAARALGPIERTQEAWRALVNARAQFTRLAQIHIQPPQSHDAFPICETASLESEGLAYIPKNASRPLFSNISFKLSGGEMLGISGVSNSGKSTLARLLAGLIHPTQGRIRYDNQDVFGSDHNINRPDIAYLSQTSALLPGTIGQNIASFADIPLDQIHKAAQLAGVDDAILEMPAGYETEIYPGTTYLSAGITQRILLARIYCQNARLLVLDEPYTHLDNTGVSSLMTALTELRNKGCMVVVISQRPSLLAQCDQVMIIDDGQARFVEKRKKAELTVLEGISAPEPESRPMEAVQ